MDEDDERWVWHDQRGVTWAAAVGAVALIVLLVVAVLRTSSGTSDVAPPETSEFSTSASVTGPSPVTTDYPVPSVQTSEDDGSGAPPAPSGDATSPEEPATSSPTTTPNPYVTTTTQNGGAV